MRIRFVEDCRLEIVAAYDEASDETKRVIDEFPAGTIVDVDITDEYDTATSWQFADGSLACGVPNELFQRID